MTHPESYVAPEAAPLYCYGDRITVSGWEVRLIHWREMGRAASHWHVLQRRRRERHSYCQQVATWLAVWDCRGTVQNPWPGLRQVFSESAALSSVSYVHLLYLLAIIIMPIVSVYYVYLDSYRHLPDDWVIRPLERGSTFTYRYARRQYI